MMLDILLTAQSAQPIPFKSDAMEYNGGDFMVVFLTLTGLLALYFLGLYLLRKSSIFPGKSINADSRLRVVETSRLNLHTSMHLIEYGDQQYVLIQNEKTIMQLDPSKALIYLKHESDKRKPQS